MRRSIIALLLLAMAGLALVFGLRVAPLDLTLGVDDPRAADTLREFRGLERNATDHYRWSFSNASIDLLGLARAPLLVDLRLTSPRPADAPLATFQLARGRWISSPILVQGDWRRYRMLVPVSGYQPELSLVASTFRPGDGDLRAIGLALSRFQLSVPSGRPNTLSALAALGPWRVVLLLSLPLLCYLLALRFLGERAWSPAGAALLALASLTIVWSQASDPLAAARFPPEPWLAPIAALALAAAWAAQRPMFAPLERRMRALLESDHARPWLLLGVAGIVGGVMVAAMPAWEHPDEASHFEFAWLIANHPSWPVPGTTDPRIASIGGGGRALYHQPLYHMLISLPLRLAGGLDLPTQLILARAVSLLLFLATVALAERIVREVTRPGQVLRWLAPFALALNPTVANLMTGVNNDVAVTLVCTWAIWGMACMLVHGLTWRRALWLAVAIPLAMLCKNTGAVLALLVPLTLIVTLWARRGWRWRPILLLVGGVGIVALAGALIWGDPALWYRWGAAAGRPAQRVERADAPDGPHALRLDPVAVRGYEGLSHPIPEGSRLSNRKVTVGAWIWASRPARVWAPGVIYQPREGALAGDFAEVEIGLQPRFVAFSYDLPPRLMFLHVMVWSVAPDDPQPLELYVDGVVLAEGAFPGNRPPMDGIWGDQPFTNLVRNGDAEQAWFYLRPWLDQALTHYARRSPARIIASLADPWTTLRLELRDYIPWMAFTGFGGAYGGRIFLRDPIWQYLIPGLVSLALAGAVVGALRIGTIERRRRRALMTLALGSIGVWLAILLAHTPPEFPGGIPSPRYGFTVIAPTMLFLAAGWLALWPPARRGLAAILLIGGLVLLDSAAVATIRLFENTVCVRDPLRCVFIPAPGLFDAPPAIQFSAALLIPVLAILIWALRRTTRPAPTI